MWLDASDIKVRPAEYKPDNYGFTEYDVALTFVLEDRVCEFIFTNKQFEEFKKSLETVTEHQNLRRNWKK